MIERKIEKMKVLAWATIVLLLLMVFAQMRLAQSSFQTASQSAPAKANAVSVKPAAPAIVESGVRFIQDKWDSENGLPQNTVLATARTREGYLWIGTQEGVTRFDGVKFKTYKDASVWANRDIFTNCLLAASDGSLWVGTRSGLNRIKDNQFTAYTVESGLPYKSVTALAEDRSGAIWVGMRGGVARFAPGPDGARFTAFTTAEGLSNNIVKTIAVSSKGSVWVGTEKGLCSYSNGRFAVFDKGSGLGKSDINQLYEDRSGAIWIGLEGGGVTRIKDGQFTTLTIADGLSNNNVHAIAEDHDGRLWIGTGDGLFYLEAGRIINYSQADKSFQDQINSIHPDDEGSIWVGTKSNALLRLRKPKFKVFGEAEGLSKDDIWCVLESRDGSLWVGLGAGGGLNRIKDGKITKWTTKDGLVDAEVLSLLEARDGGLWVGTGGGLCHFQPDSRQLNSQRGRFDCLTTQDGLPDKSVTAMMEGTDGGLWVATYNGMSYYKDGKFDNSWNEKGLAGNLVGDLLKAKDGSVWLAALPDGLFHIKDGQIRRFTNAQGLPGNQVTSVYEDDAGDLWVGTYQNGLSRIRPDGRVTAYTTRQGLPEDQVFETLEDNDGCFWMTSNHGIFRLVKQQFDDLEAGRIKQLSVSRYGISDGLRANECNGGSQPSGWKTRDGRLLMATIRGLVQIDPHSIIADSPPLPLVIEEAIVNRQPVKASEFINIGPGVQDLEIQYTGLNLLAATKIQFKYKLEGFNQDWIDAGTRRTAYYTNLPPGDYQFRVIAANAEGHWNEEGARMRIRVEKLFHQRLSFYLLCVLILGLTLYAIHRYRISRSNEKLLNQIAMSLPTAMAVLDAANNVKMLNNEFALIFGYTREDVPTFGRWAELAFPDPALQKTAMAQWQKTLGATTSDELLSISREWRVTCKDGSERDVEIKFARARDQIIVTLNDITRRKNTEDALLKSHRQLRELAARLQQAREEERTFIAREIHDELGQLLTGMKFDIKWLEKRLPINTDDTAALRKKTASLLELVDETIRALRRIATEFRPGLLDTLGLIAAIEWQAEEFGKRTGIQCKIGENTALLLSDRDRETALFRIFQEALTNVARHADATSVNVSLTRQNGAVVLQVQDNGKGITEKELRGSRSLGLLGMRERAFLFGGEVNISGVPGKGTTIIASIPLNSPPNTASRSSNGASAK